MIILDHIFCTIVLLQLISIALYTFVKLVCLFRKNCKCNFCPFRFICKKYYSSERKQKIKEEVEILRTLIFKE